jgi:hypothetical protein
VRERERERERVRVREREKEIKKVRCHDVSMHNCMQANFTYRMKCEKELYCMGG